jgi:ubiquinone/menaquinone biosynthesis C-methylase UbiE
VAESLGTLPDGAKFVDLGRGRQCASATAVPRERDVRLVAVDISAVELSHNHDADETAVADVARGLPFADGEVDLLVSRVLLEHVDGVPAAIQHIARVMKPGGRTIHFMPGRNARFALAARMLQFGAPVRLLHFAGRTRSGRWSSRCTATTPSPSP